MSGAETAGKITVQKHIVANPMMTGLPWPAIIFVWVAR